MFVVLSLLFDRFYEYKIGSQSKMVLTTVGYSGLVHTVTHVINEEFTDFGILHMILVGEISAHH